MARIYLDAWGVKGGPHGIARYCRSLVPALVSSAPQHEFIVIRPRRRSPDDRLVAEEAAPEVELPLPQTDWATLVFRPFLEGAFRRYGRPDLYHSLFHMLPLGLTRGARGPRSVVVTLHDLIAIDWPDHVKRGALATAWVKRFDPAVIPYALRHADHVVCVSDATRQRATEWVPLDRSSVVHSGVAEALYDCAPASARPCGADRFGDYVAALGTKRAYKNLACVVKAIAAVREGRPGIGLVLIGGDGGAGDEIRRLALDTAVVVTPQVGDADLAALISGARVFVVPSRAEGFGLPVLEAMALGVPVASSDIPVLHEIAGEAALWFDPERPDQLAAIVTRMLDDEALRARMIGLGRARAATFTWQKTAAATIAVYDRVLAARGGA